MKRFTIRQVFGWSLCVLAAFGVGLAQAALTPLTSEVSLASSDTALYKATENVTVALSGEATDGVFTLNCGFYIQSGVTVMIDSRGVSGVTTVKMTGSLRGGGTLAFGSGVTTLAFGGDFKASNMLHTPVFEGDVSFTEENGQVRFEKGVSLINWPSKYVIADGAALALFGTNLYTADFTLENYDINLTAEGSFAPGVTVTVPTGRTLYHRAAALDKITDSSTSLSAWSGQANYTNEANIVLTGGLIRFQDRTGGSCIAGCVSGTGDVLVDTAGGSVGLVGCLTFSGTVRQMNTNNDASRFFFHLTSGSSLENVDCVLASQYGSSISFDAAKPVTVKSLAGTGEYPSRPNAVYLARGTTVTFNEVSGDLFFDGFSEVGGEAVLKNAGSARIEATSAVTLTLAGEQTFAHAIDAAHVAIADGANISAAFTANLATLDNRGGTLTEIPSWKTKVALWTDASVASSFVGANDHMQEVSDKTAAAGQIFEWKDVRANPSYSLRAARYDTSAGTYNSAVFPYLDSNPAAVRFPTTRGRLQIATPTYNGVAVAITSTCAIAVFSSKLGGGFGLFCEKSGRFMRAAELSSTYPKASDPVCLDTTVGVRLNGTAVDGTTTGFSGGWQIVSLTTASDAPFDLRGIAHPSNSDTGSYNGGQTYSEILIFSETPTADEIKAAERYLAAKWNLTAAETPAARTLTVNGSGTTALAGAVTLDAASRYAGEIRADGALTMPDARVPWTAADVPEEGRALWVDASLAAAVHYSEDPATPNEVVYINTRDNDGPVTTNGAYYLTSPYGTEGSSTSCDRRVRCVNGWLQFAGGYADPATEWGNMLTIRQLPFAQQVSYTESAGVFSIDNVRGGAFALDTSRNGGSFMLSAANGTTGTFLLRAAAHAAKRIWRLNSDDADLGIDTWLDGVTVDGFTTPFNGRVETLTFKLNDSTGRKVKCFGYPSPSAPNASNNEIMGEWMLYTRDLVEEELSGLASYLMKKWQGTICSGYCETREMRVAGSCDLVLQTAGQLPNLADGFTGTVRAQDAALAFTVPAGATEAKNAVKAAGHKLSFANPVTVSATVGADVLGDVLLVSAGELDAASAFTLGTVRGASASNAYTLKQTATGLYLHVAKQGLILIVR